MNLQTVMSLFVSLIPISFVLLPFVYVTTKEVRWSKSLSRANARPPQLVRTVETFVLGLFAFVLVLHIATGGVGMNSTPLPGFVWRQRLWICGVMSVIAFCWLVIGLRRSVSLASVGLIVCTLAGTAMLAATNALSYERFENEIRQIPLPVEITLSEQVSDVEILINGVRMGEVPLHTTIEEIETKAPPLTNPPTDDSKKWKNFAGGTYMPGKTIQLRRGRDVTSHQHGQDDLSIYVQFERKGEPIMVSGNMGWSGGSRMFGQIQPARIPFGIMTEAWDRDVNLLLAKARLADYRVDQDWLAAADTYFPFVRNALLKATVTEPAFQQVLKDWARSRYQLDQVRDFSSAWGVLERIQKEADAADQYSTDSIQGDAIDLLVDQVDGDFLVTVAQRRLKQLMVAGNSGFGYAWGTRNDRRYFSTSPYSQDALIKPSDYVLAQVVWRLDQHWDREFPHKENSAEQKLVPDLLRLSYRDPRVRQLANVLGGSIVDEFDRRQQRDIRSFEPSNDASLNEYLEGKFVLRSFWESVNAAGSSGAEFREQHRQQALALAQTLLEQTYSLTSQPSWCEFLFLDVEGREPLARDFWKAFQTKVDANEGHRPWALDLKWGYLGRIQPLPPVTDFVDAFPGQVKHFGDVGNPEQALSRLPVDLRLEVTRACIQKAAQSKSVHVEGSEPYQALAQSEFQLVRYLLTIPSVAAADAVMSYLDTETPRSADVKNRLKELATYGGLSAPLVQRLSASSSAEYRRLIVDQISALPDPASCEALSRLQRDQDPAVREAAERVALRLDELRRQPLPVLK